MDEQITLGSYIRDLMEARGLSGRAVTHYGGISQGTLNKVLHDKGSPKPATLEQFAEFFNVPLEMLLRLAGHLPEDGGDERPGSAHIIEQLMSQLPEDKQREIVEIVKLIHRLYHEEHTERIRDGPIQTDARSLPERASVPNDAGDK